MPKQFVLTAEVADGDFADITIKMNPDDVGVLQAILIVELAKHNLLDLLK